MATQVIDFVKLTDRDRDQVHSLPKIADDSVMEMRIVGPAGQQETAPLPARAAALVGTLLDHLARGEKVAILSEDQEVSPNDAATILGMSRPLVVHRMEVGDLQFHYVGKHRRAKLKDVLALKTQIDEQRVALDALAAETDGLMRIMAYRPVVAVYDACVLYPFHIRNLLIQCAVDRLVEARWTNEIHDEWIRNLVENHPGLPRDALDRVRDLMNRALPRAEVTGYERNIAAITRPRPRRPPCGCSRDRGTRLGHRDVESSRFPLEELARHHLTRTTPDTLLTKLYETVPDQLVAATANARRNLTRSESSPSGFLAALDRQRLHRFAKTMTVHLSEL